MDPFGDEEGCWSTIGDASVTEENRSSSDQIETRRVARRHDQWGNGRSNALDDTSKCWISQRASRTCIEHDNARVRDDSLCE